MRSAAAATCAAPTTPGAPYAVPLVCVQRLRAINPALLQRLCCRLFFVVNKVREGGQAWVGAAWVLHPVLLPRSCIP